jgi:phospholipid/cholesterol/gamma-HCH transport system substrate-binding protein
VFFVVSMVAISIMVFGFMGLPHMLFGTGHYTVTVQLPRSGGLYDTGNVTYRGTEVGRVEAVHLTESGVDAVLSLDSNRPVPSDLKVEVHSVSPIGEQYIALVPQSDNARPLADGDVIPVQRASVPPDINSLLDATNRGLEAIPHDNLKTVVDESYVAVGGLGPEISRFVKSSTKLATGAREHLDELTNLIDNSGPILDSQADTSDSISQWASHLANVSSQLAAHDDELAGVLQKGPGAADEARKLLDRLQPTVPVLLANLVSIGQVALTYQQDLEQLLVLVPQGTAAMQGLLVPNLNTKQKYRGAYLSFNLNLNLPPACTTGFLPIQQQRVPSVTDAPDRPSGDLYCRVPQDAAVAVRGARNYPCETVPGKRAPTVKMCESPNQYVPLNDGVNWKGDPNATSSGQDIPQRSPDLPAPPAAAPPDPAPPAAAPPDPAPEGAPPIAAAEYDPATGTYVGPDGQVYRQSDVAQGTSKEKTWQSLLTPPTGN